jgi:hypothetical protein
MTVLHGRYCARNGSAQIDRYMLDGGEFRFVKGHEHPVPCCMVLARSKKKRALYALTSPIRQIRCGESTTMSIAVEIHHSTGSLSLPIYRYAHSDPVATRQSRIAASSSTSPNSPRFLPSKRIPSHARQIRQQGFKNLPDVWLLDVVQGRSRHRAPSLFPATANRGGSDPLGQRSA